MHTGLDGEDIRIVIVDVKNMKEQTGELAREYELTMPILLDEKDISHQVYEIVYTPTTFVIDSRGRAVFRHVGFTEGQEAMLEKEIRLIFERD